MVFKNIKIEWSVFFLFPFLCLEHQGSKTTTTTSLLGFI